MAKTNEISYCNTATTHKPRLYIVPDESAWSCYWVSEYSFRYKPWFFVEVDDHWDLQKNNWIFIPVCTQQLPLKYQTQVRSFQSLDGTKWSLLISFPCISCISSSFNTHIGIFSEFALSIFEFLGGLVIYSSYQVQQITYLKSFHFLFTYPRKVFSAWTEVWTGAWPSTAPIMAPGGRDLGDFGDPGRAGDIYNSISMPNYYHTCLP